MAEQHSGENGLQTQGTVDLVAVDAMAGVALDHPAWIFFPFWKVVVAIDWVAVPVKRVAGNVGHVTVGAGNVGLAMVGAGNVGLVTVGENKGWFQVADQGRYHVPDAAWLLWIFVPGQ